MSNKQKKKTKVKGLEFPCPVCIDNGDIIPLQVEKNTYKSAAHSIRVNKEGELYVDYSTLLNQVPRKFAFIMKCPKCSAQEVYHSEKELIKDMQPFLEFVQQSGWGPPNSSALKSQFVLEMPESKKKHEKKEEELPEIVRPGELEHADASPED